VKKPTARLDAWADAHKRFHLSDLHIQMARELGLNPKRLMLDSGVLHIVYRTEALDIKWLFPKMSHRPRPTRKASKNNMLRYI
jgi:hypothetical protein